MCRKTLFNGDFINTCDEDTDVGYFIEDDVQFLQKFHDLHRDLSFLPVRTKVKKDEELVANFHDQKNMSYTKDV